MDDSDWDPERLALSPSEMTKEEWLQLGPPTPTPDAHAASAPPPAARPPLPHAHTWTASHPARAAALPAHPFFQTQPAAGTLAPEPVRAYGAPLGAYPVPPAPMPLRAYRSVSFSSAASGASADSGSRWSLSAPSDSASEYGGGEPYASHCAEPGSLDELEALRGLEGLEGLDSLDPRHGSRVGALSIDPSLFRPKEKVHDDTDDDDSGDALDTARPGTTGQLPVASKGKASKEARDEAAARKKVSHARKQNADHIPRPRNAFILFRKHVVDAKLIPPSVEMRHQNVSIITARMWREAPADQKAHFNELARIEKDEHMRKYPGYRYQPVYRRTNVIRRRVRKDEAEEERCRSVAELLLQGKHGDKLEQEIQDSLAGETAAPKKAPSRRSSAIELSKGALRALRARAKAQSGRESSAEWSDAASAASGARGGHSRRPSLLSRDASVEPAAAAAYAPQAYGPSPAFSYPAMPEPHYGYAQPHPEAAAYDAFGMHPPGAPGPYGAVPPDVVFGAWGPEPSPTTPACMRAPPSATGWGDGAYAATAGAPSDMPLDALPFDEGLFSFEHALAQADEVGGW